MRHLVVGVDGSVDSLAALDWAADAVGPAGRLTAVHASPLATPAEGEAAGETRRRLAAWTARARTRCEEVECDVVDADVAEALSAAAVRHGSAAIVVGPHGLSVGHPKVLGSVTAKLLHSAHHPVVVARHGSTHPLRSGGTIVVGVGHDSATRAALRWAASLARDRSMALSLVHAVGTRPVFRADGLLELLAYYIDPAKLGEWAEDDLADLAAELRASGEQELPISWAAPSGAAGPRLVKAASDAALLVVGGHRDGALTGKHFTVPSIHHVVTHAPCPVAVVPSDA